jgi:YrbI family 3-deoxy-D-manno-octulosonate 8-phosphate phosphatase
MISYDQMPESLRSSLADVRMLVLDFDGTLTDNHVYVHQDGTESVRADRGDGLGLELLRKHTDVSVQILSRETNPVTAARAKKLGIPCIHGLETKIGSLRQLAADVEVDLVNVCYVGNDLNDLECIEAVGVGIAVADAYPQVLRAAHHVTTNSGGNGAVREVCEWIMYAKNAHPYP